MKLTRIDLNSWLIRLAEKTILIDPWLVDPLTFYGQPWLFQAYHENPLVYTPETLPAIDLILISQGLDDHCHKPTLQQLERRIPVIACSAAAKIVQKIGYTEVYSLRDWQAHHCDRLTVVAVPGPEIQGQKQNGYLLLERSGAALYYEPHISHKPVLQQIQRRTAIDVLLIPVVGQIFPVMGQVVMGPEQALEVVEVLRPRTIVPTSVGDLKTEGILPKLIQTIGSTEEFASQLQASGLPTQFCCPKPGQTLEVGRSSSSK